MVPADVEAAVELSRAQGFRDRRRFWDFVLRVETCHPLAGVVDGRLIATGLATANGPVGWLGGIVVDAGMRGRGYGRAITEELIRLLREAGCETISLESTDAGQPMYERMGFRLASHYHQLQADHVDAAPPLPAGARVRMLDPADVPAICELDRQATAEDRSAALTDIAAYGGWVLEDETAEVWATGEGRNGEGAAADRLRGFLIPAERAYGPIIAPRFEDGLFLLDFHRSVVPAGDHVRAGIPHEHEAAWRELLARGWQETWRAPRMLLGPDVPWRPEWIWGQINSAMG